MIISASRRTDIPAFFGEWFMNRIEAGFCLVPNPFNAHQVSRVSLKPVDVDALVFWSKNPAPLESSLTDLDHRGLFYYFLVTLNDYPVELEPNLPDLEERLATFARLSQRIGMDRIAWRYDPIIISNVTTVDYHRKRFAGLCRRLAGLTRRVHISVVSYYRKTERRLSALEPGGLVCDREAGERPPLRQLLKEMVSTAAGHGIEMLGCASSVDYGAEGPAPGSCIDGRLLARSGCDVQVKKDPGQRPECLCTVSRDIGITDTCLHGCLYCYSTMSDRLARNRFATHDPDSPMLCHIGVKS